MCVKRHFTRVLSEVRLFCDLLIHFQGSNSTASGARVLALTGASQSSLAVVVDGVVGERNVLVAGMLRN